MSGILRIPSARERHRALLANGIAASRLVHVGCASDLAVRHTVNIRSLLVSLEALTDLGFEITPHVRVRFEAVCPTRRQVEREQANTPNRFLLTTGEALPEQRAGRDMSRRIHRVCHVCDVKIKQRDRVAFAPLSG